MSEMVRRDQILVKARPRSALKGELAGAKALGAALLEGGHPLCGAGKAADSEEKIDDQKPQRTHGTASDLLSGRSKPGVEELLSRAHWASTSVLKLLKIVRE
jgi:hypothetical protein